MNLNFVAPINETSYGLTGTHIVDELIKMGVKVALFPIGQANCEPQFVDNVKSALQNSTTYDVNAPCIRLFHQFDLNLFVGRGRHIGFPIFELDTFTEQECHQLVSCDGIITCSKWGADVVSDNLYNMYKCTDFSVKVVPLGVDTVKISPILSNRRNTIFFNAGKWEVRKGHDKLVQWFNEAFTPRDNVELWLMNYNIFFTKEQNETLARQAKQSSLGDKISIIPRQQYWKSVIDIMRQADCGVFPARAEGWNLEALEMMACGKEVILTNYSGHTEFAVKSGARLVDITGVEPAYGVAGFDDRWFKGQGNWASLDDSVKDRFITEMRKVHELKQSNRLELNSTNVDSANRFSWNNSAKKLLEVVCT